MSLDRPLRYRRTPAENDSLFRPEFGRPHYFPGFFPTMGLDLFVVICSRCYGVAVRRPTQPGNVRRRPLKGLGHGIWWAMVTMTTVGYGDKAPKTLGGRIVALVWMVVSIILVASFTAAVTASLTVDRLDGKVRGMSDLYGARVGSVAERANQGFLVKRGIAVRPFANLPEGLQALVDKKIDAFVFNELILRHIEKKVPRPGICVARDLRPVFRGYRHAAGKPAARAAQPGAAENYRHRRMGSGDGALHRPWGLS